MTASLPSAVPLLIDAPSAAEGQPVSVGVPFPHGLLCEPSFELFDGDGRPVPVQSQVLTCWPDDGSLKWVLFDFLLTCPAGQHRWSLLPRPETDPVPPRRSVREETAEFVLNTGVAAFHVSRRV